MSNRKFFEDRLEVGKSGEAVIADWFRNRGNTVVDVSDDKSYWSKDIDFIITNKDNQTFTVEVKTDYFINKTHNLFFEGVYYKESGDRLGWFYYCQADYVVFYDINRAKLFVYDFANGKDFVLQAAEDRLFYNKDDVCNRRAYLLPIDKAIEEGYCREYDLVECVEF